MHMGKQTITFRPAAPSKFFPHGRPAVRVVPGAALAPDGIGEAEGSAVMGRLRDVLATAGGRF
jgi:hypothetical protein